LRTGEATVISFPVYPNELIKAPGMKLVPLLIPCLRRSLDAATTVKGLAAVDFIEAPKHLSLRKAANGSVEESRLSTQQIVFKMSVVDVATGVPV